MRVDAAHAGSPAHDQQVQRWHRHQDRRQHGEHAGDAGDGERLLHLRARPIASASGGSVSTAAMIDLRITRFRLRPAATSRTRTTPSGPAHRSGRNGYRARPYDWLGDFVALAGPPASTGSSMVVGSRRMT